MWREIGDTRWALFGPKMGIDFAHFGLISGMVSFQFQMNKNETEVFEFHAFEEIFCLRSDLSNNHIIST